MQTIFAQNKGDTTSQGGLTRRDSGSSIRSIAKQRWQFNPLYGYSIEAIRAVKPNTIVYRVSSQIYERFLHPKTFR